MTFRQFAFNNVLRNKRTYAAYFLSSAFSVMVFFVYAIFAFHPGLSDGVLNDTVANGMHFAEAVIYVFSFFFVMYSMSAFLKTRKKEFGLMILHGMTNMQLRRMIFLENMLIGFFATIGGIGAGLISAKLMLMAASTLLELDATLPFYMPTEALLLTFVAFLLLFMVISLFTVVFLRSKGLIELIKGSAKPKPEPRSSKILSVLAVLLLAGGYGIALWVKGMMVAAALIPVAIMVIIGTYFLFTQLSVYLVRRARSRRPVFWRKTNILLFSDLAYRMKDNARIFFIVAILSTVAFSAIGSLVGFKSMFTGTLTTENPFAFVYTSYSDNPQDLEDKHVRYIQEQLTAEGIAYTHLSSDMKIHPVAGSDQEVRLVSMSDYNAVAALAGVEQVELKANEAVKLYYSNALIEPITSHKEQDYLELSGVSTVLEVNDARLSYLYPTYSELYVISDELSDRLPETKEVTRIHVFDVVKLNETRHVGERLTENLVKDHREGDFYFSSLAHNLHRTNQAFGAVLFIGFFIGVVFFVAAGSFLYFRLYTDLEEDQRKFAAITKIGLTAGELSSVITKQLAILFLVPIGVATIHGAVALNALQNMFGYSLVKESTMVLGAFVLIQLCYFLFIRTRYIRQVKMS